MSKSPGCNNLNNTVAIVARPGLRSAPTSTSFPPTHTHTPMFTPTHAHAHPYTHTPPRAHILDTRPSTLITQWIKMKTQKWMDKERGREGLGAEGRKTKCLGQDQPGISSSMVPTHWLERFSLTAQTILSPRQRTTQTQNDFMMQPWSEICGKDESWAGVLLFIYTSVVGVLGWMWRWRRGEWGVCRGKCSLLDRLGHSRGA